jgi:hypothetical protein
MEDNTDLYIKYEEHPAYDSLELESNDTIDALLTKVEMLLFTRKREVLGHHNMGFDIEDRLWRTKASAESIERELYDQIQEYIPELNNYDYYIKVLIMKGSDRDIGIVEFHLNGREIRTLYK